MYAQQYLEAVVQQRHEEALRDAQMRQLAKQADGNYRSRFSRLGEVGSALSIALGALR